MIQKITNWKNFNLSHSLIDLTEKGVGIMSASQDPLHNGRHVHDLFDLYKNFLHEEQEVKIKSDVLVPSIAWHDVWKSRRKQETHILKFIGIQLYEGIGSARIFRKYSRGYNISPNIVSAIAYCIRHHSPWHDTLMLKNISLVPAFIRLKTMEARLLRDLDWLDFFSLKRLDYFLSLYCDKKGRFRNDKAKGLAVILFRHAKNNIKFNFRWTESEFKRRQKLVLDQAIKILQINNIKID